MWLSLLCDMMKMTVMYVIAVDKILYTRLVKRFIATSNSSAPLPELRTCIRLLGSASEPGIVLFWWLVSRSSEMVERKRV